mgnify:CR=1 FL=1
MWQIVDFWAKVPDLEKKVCTFLESQTAARSIRRSKTEVRSGAQWGKPESDPLFATFALLTPAF